MNILGVDYGHKRIGLSYADTDLGVAVPISAAVEPDFESRMGHIAAEIKLRSVDMLVVGYPLNMDGTVGHKALEVDEFIAELLRRFGLPVERADERLSSHQAESDMRAFSGGGKRKTLSGRKRMRKSGDIDSRASALFLQEYLDSRT